MVLVPEPKKVSPNCAGGSKIDAGARKLPSPGFVLVED